MIHPGINWLMSTYSFDLQNGQGEGTVSKLNTVSKAEVERIFRHYYRILSSSTTPSTQVRTEPKELDFSNKLLALVEQHDQAWYVYRPGESE